MKYNNQCKFSMPNEMYSQLRAIKNITGKNLQDIIRSACEVYADKELKRLKKLKGF